MRDQKDVLTSIGITHSFEPLYKQAEGLLYPYKLLPNLTDDEMELVKVDAKDIFYSFLLVNKTDKKMYEDL